MKPEISIVVPIYNAEKWLSECIDNILSQPFHNFELLLVNDGSLDKSGEICDVFVHKDQRVKVIHKQNGGPSSARNIGIEMAKGRYITFLDADDQIARDYLLILYQSAERHQTDAVLCGYRSIPAHIDIVPKFKLNTVMNGRDFVLSSSCIHSSNDLCFAWRYFYKLSKIKENNIRFNENIMVGEDVIFNLQFLLESKRVYAIPDILYYYTVNNPQSIMRTPYKPNLESSLNIQYKHRKQISQQFDLLQHKHYRKDMAYYYIKHIFRLMINNLIKCPGKCGNHDLRRIANYPMITESVEEIGFLYECTNLKEYLYYISLKYRIHSVMWESLKKELKYR